MFSRKNFLGVLLLFSASTWAQQCEKPEKADLSGQEFIALQKRVAYAAFLAEACDFNNSLLADFSALTKNLFSANLKRQQAALSQVRSRKKTFSEDASTLGVFKRCHIEPGKTKGFISEVTEDISAFSDAVTNVNEEYEGRIDAWRECVREQRAKEEEELARKRAEEEAELARIRESERQAAILAQQEAYRNSEEFSRKKAAYDISANFRSSYSKEGTYVLSLKNSGPRTAYFKLKCFQTSGASKVFELAIPAGSSQEIGFLEGWPGNFVRGEYCKAYFDQEYLWQITL